MGATEKFMFDVSFDNEPEVLLEPVLEQEQPVEEEKEEIAAPTFSEEDLDIARQQGFEAGKQEGLAATEETLSKQIAETLTKLDQKLQAAFQTQHAVNEELANSALSVARGICSKMLPTMAEKKAYDEVDRVITDVFAKLVEHPSATISVHADLTEEIKLRVTELSASKAYQGKVTVLADQDMAADDCKVEWFNGGCERDSQSIWRDIMTIVDRNLGETPGQWDETDAPAPAPAESETAESEAAEAEITTETPHDEPQEDPENGSQQPTIED